MTLKKKNKAEWLFVSHDVINNKKYNELIEKIKLYENKEYKDKNYKNTNLWFRQEPFIIDIACRNLEKAKKLINLAHNCGLKYSGIKSLSKKIIVEIIGLDEIISLIGINGKLLINEDYIRVLTEEANKKLSKNLERLRSFKDKIKSLLS